MVYLENRRYLPKDSRLRLDSTHFPDKKKENRSAPEKKSYADLKCYHTEYGVSLQFTQQAPQTVLQNPMCSNLYKQGIGFDIMN